MSQLLRNLVLVSVPILLAGCQHPYGSSVALNGSPIAAGPKVSFVMATQPATPAEPENRQSDARPLPAVKPQDQQLVAKTQQSDSLTGQLADSLLDVFKTFTGR